MEPSSSPAATSDRRPAPAAPLPPPTRREDVVDVRHGRRIPDPYRWLEDADAPGTRAWIVAQNAVTAHHLATVPERDDLRSRLAAVWQRPRRGVPFRRGRRWFQLRNSGEEDQDVLWTADGGPDTAPADPAWRVLLDPNGWSADGTTSLAGLAVTEDGDQVAYARSAAGSDWMTWHVHDVAAGHDTDDVVPWSKFGGAEWLPDGSGFLYCAYDPPAAGAEHAGVNEHQRLRLHRIGTDPADDVVVHAAPDHPTWGFDARLTSDHRWLVVHVWEGTSPTNRVHLAALDADGTIGPVRPLLPEPLARYRCVDAVGDRLWFETDHDAPLGRVVSLDPTAPDPADPEGWEEILPERAERLESVRVVGGATADDPAWLVTTSLRHARSVLTIRDLRGRQQREVTLPDVGTVASLGGGRHDRVLHYTFETFTAPASVRRHDLTTGEDVAVFPAGLPSGGPDVELVTEQVFVTHDGVRVPVFLVHRADVEPTGRVPTILHGYGGFDISLTPAFRAPWRVWVERGGLLAVANLRGGGEYGRAWHDDGRLANKPHVFDDAIAVAEWLTGRRPGAAGDADGGPAWTASAHLGLHGASNGGLLVGACLTRRPDLWGAAVPEVGVLDLTRFHRFTIGWAWKSDYGDPEVAEDLDRLLAYSPLHNLRPGAVYPPTLVTTGDHDDRVVPAHSFKFAAALQHAQAGSAPVLIRVDTSAGHGAGKPVSKQIDERADVLAFLSAHLS